MEVSLRWKGNALRWTNHVCSWLHKNKRTWTNTYGMYISTAYFIQHKPSFLMVYSLLPSLYRSEIVKPQTFTGSWAKFLKWNWLYLANIWTKSGATLAKLYCWREFFLSFQPMQRLTHFGFFVQIIIIIIKWAGLSLMAMYYQHESRLLQIDWFSSVESLILWISTYFWASQSSL